MSKWKMSQARVGDVFHEVDDFYNVNRFAGLSALGYSRGRFRISIKWLIANVIIIIGVVIINLNATLTTRKAIAYECCLYFYLNLGLLFTYIYGIAGNFIENIRKIDLLNRCLLNQRAVDFVLFSVGEQRPKAKVHFSILLVISLIITTYILRLQLHPALFEAFNMLFIYIIHTFIVLIYLLIDRAASIFQLSFKCLRKSVIKCSGMDGKKAALLAERLIYCHHKLCNSCQDFNDFSSLQIFVALTVEFMMSFGEIYVIICIFKDNRMITDRYIIVTVKALWSLLATIMLFHMSHRFASIRNEVNTIIIFIFFELGLLFEVNVSIYHLRKIRDR